MDKLAYRSNHERGHASTTQMATLQHEKAAAELLLAQAKWVRQVSAPRREIRSSAAFGAKSFGALFGVTLARIPIEQSIIGLRNKTVDRARRAGSHGPGDRTAKASALSGKSEGRVEDPIYRSSRARTLRVGGALAAKITRIENGSDANPPDRSLFSPNSSRALMTPSLVGSKVALNAVDLLENGGSSRPRVKVMLERPGTAPHGRTSISDVGRILSGVCAGGAANKDTSADGPAPNDSPNLVRSRPAATGRLWNDILSRGNNAIAPQIGRHSEALRSLPKLGQSVGGNPRYSTMAPEAALQAPRTKTGVHAVDEHASTDASNLRPGAPANAAGDKSTGDIRTHPPLAPIEGDVFLDGALLGRWIAKALAKDAGRPPAGGVAFDPRRNPLPAGRSIGA